MSDWHWRLWDRAHWFALLVLYAYVRLTLKPIMIVPIGMTLIVLCVYVRLKLNPLRSCPLVCIDSLVCLCPVDIKAYEIVLIGLTLIVLCVYVRLILKPMKSCPLLALIVLCVYVRLTLKPMRSCPLVWHLWSRAFNKRTFLRDTLYTYMHIPKLRWILLTMNEMLEKKLV